MKFEVIVGNPPYGVRQNGSSNLLHYMIMIISLDFCTDIEVVNKETFPNTNMDKTAIYYCDRNAVKNDYDKKLDVDNAIYNAIDDEAHKLFIDGMNRFFSKEGNNNIINIGYQLNKNNTIENQMNIIISK